MRYTFILYDKKVEYFGKERAKNLFLWLNIFIPLIMTVWRGIGSPGLDPIAFMNKCNGKHHEVFLMETSTLNVLKQGFCYMKSYDKNGIFGELLGIMRRMSCVAMISIWSIMGFNITEAILYFIILRDINRYKSKMVVINGRIFTLSQINC
jgi:hypothetical protein